MKTSLAIVLGSIFMSTLVACGGADPREGSSSSELGTAGSAPEGDAAPQRPAADAGRSPFNPAAGELDAAADAADDADEAADADTVDADDVDADVDDAGFDEEDADAEP